MTQFCVYRERHGTQLLLDCQSDFFSQIATRFVVPLLPVALVPRRLERLHPMFVIAGEPLIMATQLAAAVSRSELGRVVVDLSAERDVIIRALDTLTGTA